MSDLFPAADADANLLQLEARYSTRRQLLSSTRVDGASVSLFVPTTQFPPVQTRIRLTVTCADASEARFTLYGKVKGHRPMARGATQDAGIAVSFEGEDKRAAAKMLATCAGRAVELGSSSSPRFGKNIECTLRVGNRRLPAQVRDLSVGGAFVVSPSVSRIRVGAEVVLELRRGFLGMGARVLQARVVWFGEKRGSLGFGARFLGGQEALRMLKDFLPEQQRMA